MSRATGHKHRRQQGISTTTLSVAIWSLIGVVAFIASIYLASGVVWLVRSMGGIWPMELPVGVMLFQVTVYVILALLMGSAVHYHERLKWISVSGVTRLMTWKDTGLSLAGAVIYALSATFVLYLAAQIPGFPLTEQQNLGFSQVYGLERFIAFIVFVILTPLFEELIFRGFLYGTLRTYKLPWWVPAIVVSVLFGLAHMQWNVALDVFCLSMVACALRELTGSIWAGVLLHILKNLVAFMVMFVFVQGAVG